MYIKRFLFSGLVFLLFSCAAVAQSASVYLHPNFQTIRSTSFENFATAYNRFLSTDIISEINPDQVGVGWGIGGMINSEAGLKIGLEYNKVRSKFAATFEDGAVRDFKISDGGVSLCFGYSPGEFTKLFYLYPVVGVTIGQNKLISSYTPGTNNFDGAFLNGKYKSIALKYNLGVNMAIGADHLKLLVKVHYVSKSLREDLVDNEKNLNVVENGKIGQDYADFAVDPYTYSGKYLENDFRGFRFSLGVSLDFGD